MISGWDFVRGIAGSLGVDILAPTVGNHDVISREPSDDPFSLIRGLSPKFPVESTPTFNEFWANGFCIHDGDTFRILAINSVKCHTNPQSAKRGLVDARQLEELDSYLEAGPPKPFQVAVCHHHPMLHEDIGLGTADVMENGSLLTSLLSNHGFHLIVHGHKHHPKLSYAPGATSLPVFASGSFSAGMRNGLATRTRNLFHMIKLYRDSNGHGGVRGVIRSWQFQVWRGWTQATWGAADFPHTTGFGCYDLPDTLAGRVEESLRRLGDPFVRWQRVSGDIPELRFVPPTVFEAVGKCLKNRGIEFSPNPPDEPNSIGFA